MQSGTVKFYNEAKGFGFIITDGSLEEVFVHMSGIIDAIREGDKVTFNTTAGKKGTNAGDVKLAD